MPKPTTPPSSQTLSDPALEKRTRRKQGNLPSYPTELIVRVLVLQHTYNPLG